MAKEDQVMDIDESELARIKKMIYAGKADICWFLHRKEVKGLIKLAEEALEKRKNEP